MFGGANVQANAPMHRCDFAHLNPFAEALVDAGGFTGCHVDRAGVNGDNALTGREFQTFPDHLR